METVTMIKIPVVELKTPVTTSLLRFSFFVHLTAINKLRLFSEKC
jgi:hypothetical protein